MIHFNLSSVTTVSRILPRRLNSVAPSASLLFRRKDRRSFHPLFFAGMLLKKATFWAAMNSYGYPRAYRRILEQTKIHVEPQHRQHVNNLVKSAFRAPTEFYSAISDSKVYPALVKIAKQGDDTAKKAMPPFLYTLIRAALEASAPVKYSAGVRSAVHRKSQMKNTPKTSSMEKFPGDKKHFSSSPRTPQEEPLHMFVRREAKIILGLSVGTALLLYLYRELKPSDGGPDDLPAARYRHDLATRAVANKQKGNIRKAIECYEELLALEVGRQHLLPPPAPGKEFTLELHVLWQLGELNRKIGQRRRAVACFEEAARKAERRNLALESGALYDRAASCIQDQLIESFQKEEESRMGSTSIENRQRRKKLATKSEDLYLSAVKQLLPLDKATEIFAVAAKLGSLESLTEFLEHSDEAVDTPLFSANEEELAKLASGVLYNLATLFWTNGQLEAAAAVATRSAVLAAYSGVEKKNLDKILYLLEELSLA